MCFMIIGTFMSVTGISIGLYDEFRKYELKHLKKEKTKSILNMSDFEFNEHYFSNKI